jgi:hypothetical protein
MLLDKVSLEPVALAATVEAKLRAPMEAKRGAAASSLMKDRRSFPLF